MADKKILAELINDLPADCMSEVQDFVEFLMHKHGKRSGRVLRQDWAGALRKYRDQYSSVSLQHQASQWRIE